MNRYNILITNNKDVLHYKLIRQIHEKKLIYFMAFFIPLYHLDEEC